MNIHLLVLQHTEGEGPGNYLIESARNHRASLTIIKTWREPIPSLTGFEVLLILGGSPNVDEEHKYPHLTTVKETIREALTRDMPCLGFCLGHQLLAEALGARVGPNFAPSVGFTEGFLTHDGRMHPAFNNFPGTFSLFKWHGQAVLEPLPKKLHVLLTSKECQVEAFSVHERPHILGVQFDNHAADRQDIETWLHRDRDWIRSMMGRDFNTGSILEYARQRDKLLNHQFDLFFSNYLKMLRT